MSLFVVVIAVALFITVGLVVDGGGKVRSLQKAESAATQAARAGGQAIQHDEAVRGEGTVIDAAAAKQAAAAYLRSIGVQGTTRIVDGTHLVVRTTTHHSPIFLGIVGIGTMTTHGEAEARLVRGIDGGEIS